MRSRMDRHRELAHLETEGRGNLILLHRGLAVEEQRGLSIVVGKLLRLGSHLAPDFHGLDAGEH